MLVITEVLNLMSCILFSFVNVPISVWKPILYLRCRCRAWKSVAIPVSYVASRVLAQEGRRLNWELHAGLSLDALYKRSRFPMIGRDNIVCCIAKHFTFRGVAFGCHWGNFVCLLTWTLLLYYESTTTIFRGQAKFWSMSLVYAFFAEHNPDQFATRNFGICSSHSRSNSSYTYVSRRSIQHFGSAPDVIRHMPLFCFVADVFVPTFFGEIKF